MVKPNVPKKTKENPKTFGKTTKTQFLKVSDPPLDMGASIYVYIYIYIYTNDNDNNNTNNNDDNDNDNNNDNDDITY